jgi:hypothetical protein
MNGQWFSFIIQFCHINVRQNRRGNQEWTIQRNWMDYEHKAQDEDKQSGPLSIIIYNILYLMSENSKVNTEF